MGDAKPTDLSTITHKTSTISASPSREHNEVTSSPRCLSPVLNTNNSHRKSIYSRKRSKSRVKLTKRFSNSSDTNPECDQQPFGQEDYINRTINDLENLKSNQVGDRLIRIQEFDRNKKKLLDSLFVPTKTYVSDRKPNLFSDTDEFNFKKPSDSPISVKKIKPHTDAQDFKGISTNRVTEKDYVITGEDLTFQGFRTGSGKNITVSPEKLRKNVELFGDLLDINDVEAFDVVNVEENIFKRFRDRNSDKKEDVSFMQTSISDTQLIHAADIALEMIDYDVLPISSSTSNIKNNCDGALSLQNSKENQVEYEMLELDKRLRTNIKNSENNKNINTESYNFKGFTISEHKFAERLSNTYSKLIQCCAANDFQEVTDSKRFNRNGKHLLEDRLSPIPSKRFKFEDTECGFVNLISSSEKINSNCIDFSDCGFKTASKKPIKMLPSSMNNAQRIYKQICEAGDTLEGGTLKKKKEISLTNTLETKSDCTDFCGSKKIIKRLPSSLENAQNQESKENNKSKGLEKNNSGGIPLITNNPTTFKKTSDLKTEFLKKSGEINPSGFSTVGKNIKTSETSWKKLKSEENQNDDFEEYFQNEDFNIERLTNEKIKGTEGLGGCTGGFTTGSGMKIKISKNALKKSENLFADESLSSNFGHETTAKSSGFDINPSKKNIEEASGDSGGFTTGRGMKIKISKNALKKSENLFTDEDLSSNFGHETTAKSSDCDVNRSKKNIEVASGDSGGFTTGRGMKIKISMNALQKSENLFADEDLSSNLGDTTGDAKKEFNLDQNQRSFEGSTMSGVRNTSYNKQKSFDTPRDSPRIPKKRLGISACKQIKLSNDKLQKAKCILEEDSDCGSFTNSPVRFNKLHSSTPLKEISGFKNTDSQEKIKLENTDITPVKKTYCNKNITQEIKFVASQNENTSPIIIREQIKSDIKSRLEKFSNEYEDLIKKMEIIVERKKALVLQEELIKNADDAHRRPKPSTLLLKKKSVQKISLKELCGRLEPYNRVLNLNIPKQVLEITPKNAKYVHFNRKNEKYESALCTIDGAIVIPNADNFISLTEISTGFEAMPGVDPRLLPKKWISNHFKWIAWKLASLERNFPDLFLNFLSVENVIQQLKYRYDREIDRAERPALRRILEKDDIPQKRMILCVSDIIEVSGNIFELKLTDGWYCIQTLIDQPLCKQILNGKIVIGTKLILQCAEILDCEGCHPLEVPSNVRLKINFNCTRRAAWYSKLGYQRISEQFPISLRTINADGGLIAMIKMYIARVYPLRFMEKQAGKTVWRNKKAEDKRARDWENGRMKEAERIHQRVQENYEKEINTAQKNILGKIDFNKISEINSPKLLYQILENTKDPEGFKDKMSSSQLKSAMEYRSNIYAEHQQEISSRIAKEVKNLKSAYREVTSVLKLRVVDGTECSNDSFIFNIWKPTEEHLELLKEGFLFSVYNVFPKPNGDLTANSRTHFKPESSKNNKLQRHIFPISLTQHLAHKPLFNEFDTVGTVVQVQKDGVYQDLWLTDSSGRLLHIQVREEQEKCCLLDNLIRGQSIVVMNLIFRNPYDIFGEAVANQCTTITGYPQHTFLQNGLTEHLQQLPKDLTFLLNECDKKIEVYLTKNASSVLGMISTENLFDDSSEDNTLIQTRLTTTDVAMSLIDTDQFL